MEYEAGDIAEKYITRVGGLCLTSSQLIRAVRDFSQVANDFYQINKLV